MKNGILGVTKSSRIQLIIEALQKNQKLFLFTYCRIAEDGLKRSRNVRFVIVDSINYRRSM